MPGQQEPRPGAQEITPTLVPEEENNPPQPSPEPDPLPDPLPAPMPDPSPEPLPAMSLMSVGMLNLEPNDTAVPLSDEADEATLSRNDRGELKTNNTKECAEMVKTIALLKITPQFSLATASIESEEELKESCNIQTTLCKLTRL